MSSLYHPIDLLYRAGVPAAAQPIRRLLACRLQIPLLLALFTFSGSGRADISTGLIGYWPLNGTWLDFSHVGPDLSPVNGPLFAAGRFGQAAQFDGMDDYAYTPGQLGLADQNTFSVSLWVKPASDAEQGYMLQPQGALPGENSANAVIYVGEPYHSGTQGDSISMAWYADGDSGSTICPHCWDNWASEPAGPGSWTHVAGVWQRSGESVTGSLYIDGEHAHSRTSGLMTFADVASHVMLGNHSWMEPENQYAGKMDELAIWSRALSAAEVALLAHTPVDAIAPVPSPPLDPSNPPSHTAQYNFLIGAQPYFQWDGITVGLDFSLSVPTLEPITYNPSITYPEEPFAPELDPWQTTFGTNNWILGKLLNAAAPIDINLVELTGTARLSADASAEAGIYLEEGEDHADIGASIGAGLNLTLNLQAKSDLLSWLPKQIEDLLPLDFTFQYPILGTPTFSTPEIPITLGGLTFDIDAFRSDLAAIDLLDEYVTAADVNGPVSILGIPMNFRDTSGDGEPDEASITVGASASAYAQTSATAGLDFFFYELDEHGSVLESKSIFETFGHLWKRTVEITDATVVRSDTGTVEIHPDGVLQLLTGSPAWMTTLVEIEEEINLLAFEADFESEMGAEGILQVFWDDELVASIDERIAGDLPVEYLFALPETYGIGAYALAFRLDPFTDISSDVLISSITTGYMANVPEPSQCSLLTATLIVFLRTRTRRPSVAPLQGANDEWQMDTYRGYRGSALSGASSSGGIKHLLR